MVNEAEADFFSGMLLFFFYDPAGDGTTWTTFFQNSPPSPVQLGWPILGWLIVSLS